MSADAARSAEPERLHGFAVAALLIAAAQAPLGSTMIAVALPPLSAAIGADLGFVTGLLVTSYLVASIVGQSPGGKLGDVLGHSRAVHLGILLYASGAALGLLANGVGLLTVARCTMALGGALVVPATLALLRMHVPQERHGRVFGLFGATMGLAAAIGPALGGEIVSHFGWRAIFLAHLPPLALAALLARYRPAPRIARSRKSFGEFVAEFDWAGTALLGAGLSLLVVAVKTDQLARLIALGTALAVMAAFIVWEQRARGPVLDPRLFLRRGFWSGSSVIALQNCAMYGLLFQLPQYFHDVHGTSASDTGRALFFMMLAMFVASPIGGRLADRIGCRMIAVLGSVPLLAGICWLASLESFASPQQAVLPLMLVGAGVGISGAPSQAAAMGSVPAAMAGMAAGANSTMRYLGGVAGILVLSAILGQDGARSVASHESATRVFAVAALFAAIIAFALPAKSGQVVGQRGASDGRRAVVAP